MRNMLISILLVAFVMSVNAQDRARYKNFVPQLLSAGTSMVSRTMNTSLDDTTGTISTIGFTYVGVQITPSADSIGVVASVRVSRDGSTWSPFTTIDSVISRVTAVTPNGGIELPAKYLAFPYVQFRFIDSADANFGANPSPTLRFEIVRRY